ncbi:MAG: preprotein translocase subunit YajC [Rikenellaceae bacterium]
MINFLQAAEAAPEMPLSQQLSPYIMIGLMVLVLWLFMWRPESKRRKEQAKFRDGLKKGDKIVTAGGIYGVIKEVKDVSVLIEVDSDVTLRVDKNMIAADPASQAASQK